MTTWKLLTPYGNIECHKGRSFGEAVWKKPAPDKIFKKAFFSEKGVPLESDVYAHINGKWIPSKGNDDYAKRMYWKNWDMMGRPKTIDGKKLGIVVKRVGVGGKSVSNEASLVWDAKKEIKISKIHLHRFVSKNMKYIVPIPDDIPIYVKINKSLNNKGTILLTKPVYISKNSSREYRFAIIPIGTHLCYVEVLKEDLAKPFPSDALIPSDNTEEIEDFEDESGDII